MTKGTLSVAGLATLMAGSGVLHFVSTDTYARIVPGFLPNPRVWVQVSGVAELVCGGLLANPRTRRLGGHATAALLVAVFPANMQMALNGGIHGAGFPLGNAVVAWMRLPLQLPLIWWAMRVAHPPVKP